MTQNLSTPKRSTIAVVIFIASLIVPLFWFLSWVINVYRTAWLGAVFEILWLPMILLLFILPIVSLILWIRTKFNTRSLYFYSFIILVVCIAILTALG